MEKCLLDILEEERRVVQHIDTLSDHIKLISDRRIELLMRVTCEADFEDERNYLAHLQENIDRMNEERLAYQKRLVNIRRELNGYLSYIKGI